MSNPLIELAKNDVIWPVSHPRTVPIVYQLSTLFLIRMETTLSVSTNQKQESNKQREKRAIINERKTESFSESMISVNDYCQGREIQLKRKRIEME